jgi:hypothetical protein
MSYEPNFRQPRIRSARHMAFVGSLACCVCRRHEPQVHHLTCGPEGKARGLKASDSFTVPLCRLHHDELHARGDERAWWLARGIDPLALAARIWALSIAAGRVPQPQPERLSA